MSFSVKAVESPSPQLSPYMQPYVSPQMLPQVGQRVPSMSLSEDHAPAKRVGGTDPTKYKTTLCRNWEQTGTCNFRGCTFAHGVQDLRAPTHLDHGGTPLLHSQYVSPNGTPPLMASSAAAATQHLSGVDGGPPKLEALLELLYGEVVRERELVSVHLEANRALEVMLRREQAQHAEACALLNQRQVEYSAIVDLVSQQNSLLQGLLQQHGGDSAAVAGGDAKALLERTAALLEANDDAAIGAGPAASLPTVQELAAACHQHQEEEEDDEDEASTSDSEAGAAAEESEQERIVEILRALQQT